MTFKDKIPKFHSQDMQLEQVEQVKQCHYFWDLHLLMLELLCCARLTKHPQSAEGCSSEICCYWALFCTEPGGQSHTMANSTVGSLLVLAPMHHSDLTGRVWKREMFWRCIVKAWNMSTVLGKHGTQSPKDDGAWNFPMLSLVE